MKWLGRCVVAAALAGGCTGEAGGEGLTTDRRCNDDSACGPNGSCRAGTCVDDGSLQLGDTCTQEQQCGLGLVCHAFICKSGCTDIFYVDDCAAGSWCRLLPDAFIQVSETERIPVGQCAPSECDPQTQTRCADGAACVMITSSVGACLPYCEYGFQSAAYHDSCADAATVDYACAPLGLSKVPVCLPSNPIDPPAVGVPGCDAVRNPCGPGAICVDIVCRSLCSVGQLQPCPAGQSCAPLGQRTDLFYCRAT